MLDIIVARIHPQPRRKNKIWIGRSARLLVCWTKASCFAPGIAGAVNESNAMSCVGGCVRGRQGCQQHFNGQSLTRLIQSSTRLRRSSFNRNERRETEIYILQ